MGFERLLTAEMITAFAVFLGALFGGVVAVISELRKPTRPVDDDAPDTGVTDHDKLIRGIGDIVQEEIDHVTRTLWMIERKIGEQLHRLEKLALAGDPRIRHVLDHEPVAIDPAGHDRPRRDRGERGRSDREWAERGPGDPDRSARTSADRDPPDRERPERTSSPRSRADRRGDEPEDGPPPRAEGRGADATDVAGRAGDATGPAVPATDAAGSGPPDTAA
jgi:hypothetical protein